MGSKEDRVFQAYPIENQDLADRIRKQAAILLSEINEITIVPSNEAARCVAVAKTNLETSVMWSLKALSRQGKE